MSFEGYLAFNWPLVLIVVAIIVVVNTTVLFSKRYLYCLLISALLILSLSIVDYIENYLSNLESFTIWRSILTAFKYSLLPFVLSFAGYSKNRFSWKGVLLTHGPAILFLILCFVSIPTGIVFGFNTNNNSFIRGPLGYLPFIVPILYLGFLIFLEVKGGKRGFDDLLPIISIAVFASLATILPLFLDSVFERWVYTTIAVGLLMYCIFQLQQISKHDALTGLLNRQTYYHDVSKHVNGIKCIISIDMNGLKIVNDTDGHEAGDKALVNIAKALIEATSTKERVYRMGGDEFIVLSKRNKEDVEILVDRIRLKMKENKCNVSIGYAYRVTGMKYGEAFKVADEMMYIEKNKYYSSLDN